MEKPNVNCTTTSTTTTKLGTRKHIYRKDNIKSHQDTNTKPFQASFEKNNSVNLNYLMGWEYHRMWHNEMDEYKKQRKTKAVVKRFKPVLVPKKKPEEPKKQEKFTMKRFQNIPSKINQRGIDVRKNRPAPTCCCNCHEKKIPNECETNNNNYDYNNNNNNANNYNYDNNMNTYDSNNYTENYNNATEYPAEEPQNEEYGNYEENNYGEEYAEDQNE